MRFGELISGVRIPQKLPKPEMSIRTRSVALTKLKRGRRGLNAKDNKTRAQAMPSLAETRDAQRRTRGQGGLNNPISELHAGGGPPRRAPSGVASTLRAPSTLARGETVRCAPARAPCVQGPGR